MGGSAYIATRIASPGVIEHTGQMARLQFGPLLASQHNAADAFLAACRQAGLNAELCDDIVRGNWEKFVFLVGVCRAPPRWRARRSAWCAPTPTCAGCSSRRCARPGAWRASAASRCPTISSRAASPSPRRLHTEMRASLLHDLEAGDKLEAPWLCGAVARMSAQAGLDAPVNRAVFAALKPYVNGR